MRHRRSPGVPNVALLAAARYIALDPTWAQIRDDFFYGATGTGIGWQNRVGASGALQKEPGDTNHPGVMQLTTGTNTAGYCQLDKGADPTAGTGDTPLVAMNGESFTCDAIVRLPTLPTSGEDYIARVGLGNTIDGTEPTDGFYFQSLRGGSSTDWIAKTANNGTRTVDTASAATAITAGAWARLIIDYDPGSTTCRFYVGFGGVAPVEVFSSNTNITADPLGGFFSITKSAGGSARLLDVDYVNFAVTGLTR